MSSLEETCKIFEADIAKDPTNETLHHIYGDFLDENGINDDLAYIHKTWTLQAYFEAEEFLKNYAEGISDYPREDYDEHWDATVVSLGELLDIAKNYLKTGDWHTCDGYDTPNVAWGDQTEFWLAFQTYTCIPVPSDKQTDRFIGCSC